MTSAPATLSTLTPSSRAHWAPRGAPLAAITAAGLPAMEAAPRGRETQSTAFLTAPDSEPLYSGVTSSTASASATASRRSRATWGQLVVVVEVLGVVREVGEAVEDGGLDAGGKVGDGGVGELAVGGAGAKAADEDEDVHGVLLGQWGGSMQAIDADLVVEQSTTCTFPSRVPVVAPAATAAHDVDGGCASRYSALLCTGSQ